MRTILVVDDEPRIVQIARDYLERSGFAVLSAGHGEAAVATARWAEPELIVLDLKLPKLDGLDVARALRKTSQVPIIMLTARAEEIDRVLGLEIGADDYVTKPFSVRELLARIRARLRRLPSRGTEALARYHFEDVEIDFEKYRTTRKGKPLDLTPREYDILRSLIRCRGEVVTRDRMLEDIWGYDASTTTRTVDSHILKLRQKLEDDSANPKYILSIYGAGYKFIG